MVKLDGKMAMAVLPASYKINFDLLKETAGLGLATPPGLSGFAGARPKPSPVIRLFSFLTPKSEVTAELEHEGKSTKLPAEEGEPFDLASIARPSPPQAPDARERVPDGGVIIAENLSPECQRRIAHRVRGHHVTLL